MALTIPTYPNPFDPEIPLAGAYAWLSFLAIDLRSGTGRIEFSIHPRESAWRAPPVNTIPIQLGQPFAPDQSFPTLAELMGDPEFASAFEVIGAKLYGAAAATHPAFAGATPV